MVVWCLSLNNAFFFDVDPCENTTCKHGSCEGLSENQTRCNCEEGWFGELCTLRKYGSNTDDILNLRLLDGRGHFVDSIDLLLKKS